MPTFGTTMDENRCWTVASSWGTRTRQLVYVHPRALLSGGRPRWGWADRYRLFSEETSILTTQCSTRT